MRQCQRGRGQRKQSQDLQTGGISYTRGPFWVAVGTSAPQPVGAVIAFVAVKRINGLLPFSFVFAAGAMLALIAVEMLPRAYSGSARGPSIGVAAGVAVMLTQSLLLGV